MSWIRDAADVGGSVWVKLSDFVRSHSIWISTFANAAIVLASAFEWIAWNQNQRDAFQGFILTLTGAWMAKTNIASTRVDMIKDKAHAEGVRVGTGTGGSSTFGAIIVAIGLSFLLASCSARTTGALVFTEDAVHDALARVDDGVRTVCGGVGGLLLVQPCKEVRTALLPALESGAAFNRCVATQKVGCLGPLIESGGRLVTELKKLPESDSARLISELGRAIAAAYQRTGGK